MRKKEPAYALRIRQCENDASDLMSNNHKAATLTRRLQPTDVPNSDVDTLRWLMRIRYRITFAFVLLLLLSVLVYPSSPEGTFYLTGTTLAYLFVNVFYSFALRGYPSSRRIEWIRQVQMPVELAICTVAIYFSGGVLTPMFLLYM